MTPFALPSLATSLVALALAILALTRNFRSPVNRVFGLMCLETFNWQACWFVSYFLTTEFQRYLIVKIAFSSIVFLPFTLYHFVVRFLELWDSRRQTVRFLYMVSLVFFAALWGTDLFVSGYHHFTWGIYGRARVLHPLFLVFVAIAVWNFISTLARGVRDRRASPTSRNRAKFTLVALTLFACSSVEFLINYGISFYPVGVFLILASFAVLLYAMSNYHLIDVNLAFVRWMIFGIVYGVVLGSPWVVALLFRQQLQALAGEAWWLAPFALLTVSASIWPLLVTFFQQRAATRLLRGQLQYQATLRTVSQELIGFSDVASLQGFVGKYVADHMGLASAELCVIGNGAGRTVGNGLPTGVKEILQRWMASPSRTDAYILAEELGAGRLDAELRTVRTWMARAGVSALVPGWMRAELISCVVLGPKRTGEIFTPEDFEVLEALARQSALVIKNLELFEEVAEQKRLAQYGQLMAAINHEFNNLFAILSGTLQLIAEKLGDQELRQTVSALKEEIELGQFLIRAAAAYRQKHPTPLRSWSVTKMLDEALAQAKQDAFAGAKPQFTISMAIPADIDVGGRATIPELISNSLRCLGWTCDSKAGTLQIEVAKDDPMVQLKFVVRGGEDLRAEFEKRGEWAQPGRHGGLYYFLVEMIVADHHGSLRLESTPGGGTTLIVRLPHEPAASPPAPPQTPIPQLS